MRIRIAIVVAVVLLFLPKGAAADWGWLERLSGPGPFKANYPAINVLILCVGEDDQEKPDPPTWFHCPLQHKKRGSFGVEWSRWESIRNDLFDDPESADAQVRIFGIEPNVMFRLRDGVDAGVGLGFDLFTGNRFARFTKLSFQPVKLSIAPLALFGGGRHGWTHVLKITSSVTRYLGAFDESNFCTPGRCDPGTVKKFFVEGEYRWGSIVLVDLSEVAFR